MKRPRPGRSAEARLVDELRSAPPGAADLFGRKLDLAHRVVKALVL